MSVAGRIDVREPVADDGFAELRLALTVGQSPDLGSVHRELLALEQRHGGYRHARRALARAVSSLRSGRPAAALVHGLRAAERLASIEHGDAQSLRVRLGHGLRGLGQALHAAGRR